MTQRLSLQSGAYSKPNGYIVKRKSNRDNVVYDKTLKNARTTHRPNLSPSGARRVQEPLVGFFGLGARWGEISLRGSETQTNETIRLHWNITTK